MTANTRNEIAAIDPDDIGHNPSNNPSFNDLIASRLSRRHLFGLGVGTAGAALLQACGGGGSGGGGFPRAARRHRRLRRPPRRPRRRAGARAPSSASTPVAKSLADVVTVPAGYTASVLYRLGDPIANGVPAYANDGTDAAATFAAAPATITTA